MFKFLKKSFILVLILAFFISCTKKVPKPKTLISYLPASTHYFMEINNTVKVYERFVASSFYRELIGYDFYKQYSQMLQNKAAVKSIAEKELGVELNLKTFLNLLGSDVVSAYLTPNGKNTFLLMSKISEKNQSLPKILKYLEDKIKNEKNVIFKENGKIKTLIIKNPKKVRYTNNPLNMDQYEVSYFYENDLFVICVNNNDYTQTFYNIVSGKEKSKTLVDTKKFQSVFKKLDPTSAEIIFYFSPREAAEQLKKLDIVNDLPQFEVTLDTWDVFNYVALTGNLKTPFVLKSFADFNENTSNKELLELYKIKPGKLQTLNFMPFNALLIISTKIVSIPKIIDYYKSVLKKSNPMFITKYNSFLKTLNKFLQLDLEKDLLANFNDEALFSLLDINLSAAAKIPNFAIVTKVKDKSKFDKVVSNIVDFAKEEKKLPIELGIKKYSDHKIHFISMSQAKMLGESAEIAYSYDDDFLLLSNTYGIKKMLDSKTGNIKQYDNILKDKNINAFVQLDFKSLVDNLYQAASSLRSIIDRNDTLFPKYIDPAVSLLKKLEKISSYSKNFADGMYSETLFEFAK